MTTLASQSPSLSPKSSFRGPSARRSLSDVRRPSPSLPAPSSSSPRHHHHQHHLSSSAARRQRNVSPPFALAEPTVAAAAALSVSKRRTTVDVGTQYTPPSFPPTARWPTSSVQAPLPAATTPSKRREPSTEPPGPNPRVNSQSQPDGLPAASTIATASNAGQAASPSKRPRASGGRKVLPRNYADCDVTDLGVLISGMLMELVRINDKIPLRDGHLTRFHSRAQPGISVKDYLNRLIVHATLSPPVLLSMVYYIDRMSSLYPGFTISSLTVHRFLIAAATVAAKGLSDSFWTNNTYARVGGVSAKELALLELFFLEKLDWKIVPQPEVLVEYYQMLVERSEGYTFAPE